MRYRLNWYKLNHTKIEHFPGTSGNAQINHKTNQNISKFQSLPNTPIKIVFTQSLAKKSTLTQKGIRVG